MFGVGRDEAVHGVMLFCSHCLSRLLPQAQLQPRLGCKSGKEAAGMRESSKHSFAFVKLHGALSCSRTRINNH